VEPYISLNATSETGNQAYAWIKDQSFSRSDHTNSAYYRTLLEHLDKTMNDVLLNLRRRDHHANFA